MLIEFATVYFNSTPKTVINSKHNLDESFQEILYKIDNWINEGSGWVIEFVDAEYRSISIFSPLRGSTYIELTCRLKNSIKALINIRNSDNKCFLWCHIRYLNPLNKHLERTTKVDKDMVNDLDYGGIESPLSKKNYSKIEHNLNDSIIFASMCIVMKII